MRSYPCLKRFIEACRPGCVWDILGLQIRCYTFQFEIYGRLSLCLVHQTCSASKIDGCDSVAVGTCQGHAFVMEHRWGPQQVSITSPCTSNVKGFYISVQYQQSGVYDDDYMSMFSERSSLLETARNKLPYKNAEITDEKGKKWYHDGMITYTW